MAPQEFPHSNRWSTTDTAASTRPASFADVEKASPPLPEPHDAQLSGQEAPVPNSTKSEPEQPQERPTSLDWDGPDDPLNPHNWSLTRKWFQTYTMSGVALVGTFASSVLTPGMKLAAGEFHSPEILATFAFAIYQLGLAFGGPFAAPLSETFGRRPVVFLSLPIFALFVMGAGFAPNMGALIVLRFFAGVFAVPSLSSGSGTLSDIWPPEQRSGPMSLYVATPFFGPAIGPLLGAVVSEHLGWRWTQWLTLFFTIFLVILPAPFYIESYKPVLLRKRAEQRNLPLPRLPTEGMSVPRVIHTYATKTLTRPMHMLFTEPIIAAFNLYSAFNFGLLYAFFAAFPFVFETGYGFNSISSGLTFLGLGVGIVVATITILLFNKFYYKPKVRQAVANNSPKPAFATSRIPPEERLPLAMLGGPSITVGLFMFGWSAAYHVHWIVPTIAEGLFGLGNMLIFMSCMTYITDTYGPLYSASAMASNAILRYILGGTFPLFAVQMFRGMGTQWACTLLGCLSILGTCLPFLLARYGEKLRSRSGYKRDG
jgi:multidrug resistance protein